MFGAIVFGLCVELLKMMMCWRFKGMDGDQGKLGTGEGDEGPLLGSLMLVMTMGSVTWYVSSSHLFFLSC